MSFGSGCGLILGGGGGYRMICGGLWMGRVVKCEECEEKELRRENLRLQNEFLKRRKKISEGK